MRTEGYYHSLSIAQAEKLEAIQQKLDVAAGLLTASNAMLVDSDNEITRLQKENEFLRLALQLAEARINWMVARNNYA